MWSLTSKAYFIISPLFYFCFCVYLTFVPHDLFQWLHIKVKKKKKRTYLDVVSADWSFRVGVLYLHLCTKQGFYHHHHLVTRSMLESLYVWILSLLWLKNMNNESPLCVCLSYWWCGEGRGVGRGGQRWVLTHLSVRQSLTLLWHLFLSSCCSISRSRGSFGSVFVFLSSVFMLSFFCTSMALISGQKYPLPEGVGEHYYSV